MVLAAEAGLLSGIRLIFLGFWPPCFYHEAQKAHTVFRRVPQQPSHSDPKSKILTNMVQPSMALLWL